MDLINNVKDRELVMKEENKVKLLDILRKFGNVVDYMTEPMVADFYGVSNKCIENYGNRNSKELSNYGYKVYKRNEILNLQVEGLENIPNRGLRLYPIQAVIVIGMMLTESKVAEQLRSEIIKELFSPTVNEEKRLSTELGEAIMNGDMEGVVSTTTKIFAIKNKRIKTLEGENKRKQDIIDDLVYNISLAEKRQRINDIIRHGKVDKVRDRWNLLYKEFNLRYHMDINRRANNKGISKIECVVQLGKINELYELTVKLFESDVEKLLEQWKNTIESGKLID